MAVPEIESHDYSLLPYRIAFCSGEDPLHQANELLTPGEHCKGWQTPAHCIYPQTLVLQFMGVVHLKMIQFLSHHTKIASKIELFSYAPDKSHSLPKPDQLDELKFKRVGHLTLRTNEENGYTARELKSVHVDLPVFYLKILFYKCYTNPYNKYNQVGILSINCCGDTFYTPKPSVKSRSEPLPEYDENTKQKIELLQAAKARALELEDFDKARKIKEALEKLKGLANQLAFLEQKKVAAIKSEDYTSAKVIKIEIDRLRRSVLPEGEDEPVSAPSLQAVSAPPKNVMKAVPLTQDIILDENETEIPPKPVIKKKVEVSLPAEEEDKNMYKKIYKKMGGKEEKKKPQLEEEPEENTAKVYLGEHAEPLSAKNKKIAEPYFTLFDLSLLEMLFSKTWGFRDSALDILKDELVNKAFLKILCKVPEKILTSLLGLMSHLITDKIFQVAMKAMAIVDLALKHFPLSIERNKAAFNFELEKCLAALMDRLGDSNTKIRLKAHETCVNLSVNPNIGLKGIVSHMALCQNKKTQTSGKHLQGKLKLLNELIQTYSLDSKDPATKTVIELGVSGVKNATAEVRNEAYSLLVEIYKLIGNQIHKYLEDLRPAQREILEEEFSKISGEKAVTQEDEPKTIVTTNIKPQGGSVSKPVTKPVEIRKKPLVKDPEKQCEYCGKYDPNFTSDNLDLHMFKACPMLYLCRNCGNVVEIITLNEHLIKECASAKKYKECPVCKEAIIKDHLDDHVQEGGCAAYNPEEAIRCPLCHADIRPATIEAWKDHILSEGCPCNPRKVA